MLLFQSCLGFVGFLNVWFSVFHQFWENLGHFFFNYCLCSFFPLLIGLYLALFIVTPMSLTHSSTFSIFLLHYASCWIFPSDLYSSPLIFPSAVSNLLLKLFLNFDDFILNSRIYILNLLNLLYLFFFKFPVPSLIFHSWLLFLEHNKHNCFLIYADNFISGNPMSLCLLSIVPTVLIHAVLYPWVISVC